MKMGGLEMDENEKATEIKLCNFQRPYMRGFWLSTMSFFIAFLGWFCESAHGTLQRGEGPSDFANARTRPPVADTPVVRLQPSRL
eukprot:SAG31_NODE_89_length_26711_cov_24.949459_8_plen_85_part_00